MKKVNTVLLIAIIVLLTVSAVFLAMLCMDKTGSSGDDTLKTSPSAENAEGTAEDSADPQNTDGQGNNGSEATAGQSGSASENSTDAPRKEGTLEGITVCIDAGHQLQGNTEKESCAPWPAEQNINVNNETMKSKCTSGTTGAFTGIPEYITVLEISKVIETTLESLGAEVVMVRDDHDVNLSNIDRAQIGNNANADVTLRIHGNGSDNPSVSGIDLYVRGTGDGTSEYAARSYNDYNLACELIDYLVEATGAKKRNVTKTDSYTGINWSEVPCILIECGFLSNETEDHNLNDPEYQQKIADGIANWLLETTLIE